MPLEADYDGLDRKAGAIGDVMVDSVDIFLVDQPFQRRWLSRVRSRLEKSAENDIVIIRALFAERLILARHAQPKLSWLLAKAKMRSHFLT